ncbi:hypothetical protein [Bifidobacterium pseudolongum]|uniref:Uncharacterized protein n=1 Tax=Bifidobacterium pseudolongum subsp. globosum TaxID=1690 RepID=A0A4Q5AQW0_9BIFI|nr:hypothetical protein [Bifidobacterium pseudolongum]RYQ36312.1 hypothetical protein PG2003B_1149 [Bifidobacterium pseudolongum subsp. globosum]
MSPTQLILIWILIAIILATVAAYSAKTEHDIRTMVDKLEAEREPTGAILEIGWHDQDKPWLVWTAECDTSELADLIREQPALLHDLKHNNAYIRNKPAPRQLHHTTDRKK